MAFRHGKFAEITVNTKAMSAFCSSMDLGLDCDMSDTSTFLSTWKTALAGLAGGKLDISGDYDPTVTTGPAAVLIPLLGAAQFAVLVYPGGNVVGQVSRSFNALLSSYNEGSPIGGVVTFKASMLMSGALTIAQL